MPRFVRRSALIWSSWVSKIDDAKNNTRGQETVITTEDSKVAALLVPTNEELMIARDTMALVG